MKKISIILSVLAMTLLMGSCMSTQMTLSGSVPEIQLKPEHFDYFDKSNIKYSIAYPNIDNWNVIEKRCKERGNNNAFITRLKEVFKPYYKDAIQRNYEKLYILNENETLEDILKENNVKLI